MTTTIYHGDCRAALKMMPPDSVHCVVTSPPYYGLRDYGTGTWEGGDPQCEHQSGNQVADSKAPRAITAGVRPGADVSVCRKCGAVRVDQQLGLEKIPDCLGWATGAACGKCYVCHLVAIFREVRRVLRDDGTVWLNLGDSYTSIGHKKSHSGFGTTTLAGGKSQENMPARENNGPGLKHKDLMGIPWRVALALQADGWYLRTDVVWAKPNALPESVEDRPTRAHEFIFLLSKKGRYFYDHVAVREPNSQTSGRYGAWNGTATAAAQEEVGGAHGKSSAFTSNLSREEYNERHCTNGRNRRSVWAAEEEEEREPSARDGFKRKGSKRETAIPGQQVGTHREDRAATVPDGMRNARTLWHIPTRPFPGAHFAVFPEALIEPCILAGTSAVGCCSMCGAPWRRAVGEPQPADGRGSGNVERKVAAEGERGRVNTHLGSSIPWSPTTTTTVGWEPTCGCCLSGLKLAADDREIVATPTGSRAGEDPSALTGRAGFNRPRGGEGRRRLMTRYEQRRYAEQLKKSPYRQEMEEEAGPAFAHYIRKDRAGARPVPPQLLDTWLGRGWLTSVVLPDMTPPAPIPSVVLDPFGGSGTVAMVCERLDRDAILCDLKLEYVEMAADRVRGAAPLLTRVNIISVVEVEE